MAEDITNSNAGNPNQSMEGFKAVTQKLADNDKTLGKIAESSNDTGEKIGDLLKRHKEGNDTLKEVANSLNNLDDSNKKMLENAAEEKRESKIGGKAGANEVKIEKEKEKKNVTALSDLQKSITDAAKMFKSKDGLFSGNFLKTIRVRLTQGFGNIFAGGAGLLLGTLSTALPKLISNFEILFKPITFILKRVGFSLEGPANFFGKLSTFFSETGPFINKTLGFIEKTFGNKAGTIFLEAFEIGAKIGKILPFLAIIPTAIETVVSAFEMLMKGDIKGAFKTIVVGFIKGFAAFFTFGLSDLVLDFDRMFKAFSEPLDDIIDMFGYVFGGISKIFVGTWNDLIKPAFDSIVTFALKPMISMFFSIGKAIGSFVGVILDLIGFILKPFTVAFKIIGKLIGVIFETVYDKFLGPLFAKLQPYILTISIVVGKIFTAIGEFFDGVSAFFNDISLYLQELTKIFDLFGEDTVGGMTDIFDAIAEVFEWIGGIIVDGIFSHLNDWWEGVQLIWDKIVRTWNQIVGYIMFALNWWGDLIKSAWDYVFGLWDDLTDALAYGMLWWWDAIKSAWNYVFGLWDQLTDMLAYGMLWWKDAIIAAWDYVFGLWDELTDMLAYGMLWWKDAISEAWDYVVGLWETLTDMLAYGMLWWKDAIIEAWDYVVGLYNNLIDALAYGILWWKDKIFAAWDYVVGLYNDLVDAFAYGILWWKDKIFAAWDYVVGLYNDLVDAFAYGILWWKDLIDQGWQKVTDTWNFVIDALAEALAPVAEPINAFFDKLKQVWDYLMGKVDAVLGWFGLVSKKPEISKPSNASEAEATQQKSKYESAYMKDRRERMERESKAIAAMIENDPTGKYASAYEQMKSANGSAGGAGASKMNSTVTPAPIIINNSPTTNVGGGGGGAMPVVISPTPVRNMDPTRGLINT